MPCGYLCPAGNYAVKSRKYPQGHKARELPWGLNSVFMPRGSLPHIFLALSRSGKIQNPRLSASKIYVLNSYLLT